MLPLTDTHQHLWDLSELRVPWLESVPALNRSFTMEDYLPVASSLGVTRSVYVEVDVAKGQEDDELAYVTALCSRDDNPLAGIVAAGDPMAQDFEQRVLTLAEAPFVKGVRQVLHTPEQPRGRSVEPHFVDGIRLLGKHGLCFDLCLRPAELGDAVTLARHCPETTLVIDHCGNASPDWFHPDPQRSDEANAAIADFRATLEELAGLGNTVCKLSGIVARLDPQSPLEALEATLDFCVAVFGYERCMIGSDWPVCTLRAELGEWLAAARAFVDRLQNAAREAIFSENAARVYRLE